jgi:glucose/arabinose dehydrogenase
MTLDPGTELVLFNVDDPEDNHNGGNHRLRPDGFLYIGIGDGGGGGDAHGSIGNGQLLTTLLGKMLRIDVSASTTTQTYAIPASNPYAANPRCNLNGTGAANCPEIYAYGFRNPWRWSFDRDSGQLWVNDVGQSTLEEVDLVILGGNYGWRCFEGTIRSTPPAVRIATAPSRPLRSTGAHRAFRLPVVLCIEAMRFPRCEGVTCSVISAAPCGTSRAIRCPR